MSSLNSMTLDAGKVSTPRRLTDVLFAALEITRPHNCTLVFGSVLLGGWLGVHSLPPPLLLAALSAGLVAAGGYAFNDLWDIATDRLNKPGRPLPSERLPIWLARTIAFGLTGLGIGLALILPATCRGIVLAAVLGLLLYNRCLKGVPLAGNLLIGGLGGLTFLYGGAAVQSLIASAVPAAFASLYHTGREILKDLEDVKGDHLRSGGTLPLKWGVKRSQILITFNYLLVLLATPLPFLFGLYGLRYLAGVLLLDAFLAYIGVALWRDPSPGALSRLNRLLKVGMVIGLGAIFVDNF